MDKPKLNPIDKLVGYINPKEGLRRITARRSYEAAGFGRRNKSMKSARSTSANIEIGQSLPTLRDRSRLFVRNNGWAKRALTSNCDNVIGQGIRPAPAGTLEEIKKVKEVWKAWAETTECDYDGKNTFYGLQDLIFSEMCEAGDCLVIRRRVQVSKGKIPIQLQVLEGDQLDHARDGSMEGGYARLGVQFNLEGKRVGYWIFKNNPVEYNYMPAALTSELVSVEDVIHPFELLRAGQVRGVPMGVAAFVKLSDFSDYEDAQLVRQKAAAAFTAFVTGKDSDSNSNLESLEPGIIEYLNEGESITFSNPPAADGYDTYSKKILQGIAAAYGITYEMLTMDYSNVNFSSGRMAMINISTRFKKLQYNTFVPQVCVPVWGWFMDAAIMSGVLKKRIDCNAMDWTAPRIQQLDPVKETNASILRLQAGLTTWGEVIREDGRDPEEFLQEYASDIEKLKAAGVNFSSIILQPEQTIING